MISYEGLAAVAVAFGLMMVIQKWQDHQTRREQDEERRKASLTPAE